MRPERLRVVEDLRTIPAEQWRPLALVQPAFRLEVFRSLAEQSIRPRCFKAFMIEDSEGASAAAVCQAVTQAAQYSPLDSLLFGRARKLCEALHLSPRPYLSFSLPLGGGAAISVRAADANSARRCLNELLDGIETYASQRRFGVAFMGIEQDALPDSILRERGYLACETPPTTMLAVEWNDIDGYVTHLRRTSASAASTVRNELTRAHKHGVAIRQIPCDDSGAQALYEFASRHYRLKNGVEPVYAPDFFLRLASMLGEDFLLFEARRNGARTAMLGAVRSAEVAWVTWLGFDANERPNDFTYFNLAYYALAAFAPVAGIRTLLYGNGAYDAKLRRGCRMTRCGAFYRPHSSLMRGIASCFFLAHRTWYKQKKLR